MKQNLSIALSLTLFLLFTSSCLERVSNAFQSEPKGPTTEQSRQMQNISGISTCAGISVEYTQADSLSLVVKAPADIIEFVRTQFKDSTLILDFSKQINLRNINVIVQVAAPTVTNFLASSGGSIEIHQGLNIPDKDITISTSSGAVVTAKTKNFVKNISLQASSGSKINIDSLATETACATSSSGAEINISGSCSSTNLIASSGSEISATKLTANDGTATASSGSEISCNIEKPISIVKSSGGSIQNK